ncbi:lysylphosphatidylglycerol synthase transmembrane domain-containing protein [Yinghuangia seranimata]|uniref:lysylphosphatidylglycerol synthase transmembrane domain-containing protein n=1 Tax=Yinghuangia seranimata TaxID=408067 RepID=UPI00248B14A8|nr:lysylphosphatidylglycerol synthase transmembrane domain-containing protein [Yinghuangia seranimata]MDI2131022.1 lysylphosphatidylglycerol synthase transmembrane domain-containing protein [Yinghuangia seranimata]
MGAPDTGRALVVEPSQPARVHRSSDLLRVLFGLLALVLIFVLASIATETTSGLESDIVRGAQTSLPRLILNLSGGVFAVAVLVVPVAYGVERLLRRDGLRVADGVIAAALTYAAALGLDWWVTGPGPDALEAALTRPLQGGGLTDPVHGYLAPIVAYITAVGLVRRPKWQALVWTLLALNAATVLVGGYTTPLALLTSVLLGRTIAYATMYAVGVPNRRPPAGAVVAALGRFGLVAASAVRTDDGPDDSRRYAVRLTDDQLLDVTVLDRDQQTSGAVYRFYRRVRLRVTTARRTFLSLRRALEQESLMAYAAADAGVRTPRLVATTEVGSDAALLAYAHIPGRLLDALDDDEITDELLVGIWRQIALMQAHRLTHRRLGGGSFVIDDQGLPWLIDLRAGEIASGDLSLRIDTAQLLTAVALRVGEERSVRTATQGLGVDAVAASLPLLQKVALSRNTRAALRKQQGLLSRIREQILELRPRAEAEPIRLERIRPRTLVTVLASAFAGYFLLSQLTQIKLGDIFASANWGWAAIGFVASALSYVAAALMLLGFVPERLSVWRTTVVQLAGSFVKLVMPAAVSGVALNARYLQKAGVPPALAAASIGVSQLGGLVFHIGLLVFFGYIAGTEQTPSFAPSGAVIAGLLVLALGTLLVMAVPQLRRFIVKRLGALFSGIVPRLLDVLQTPNKLAAGLGGTVMLTLSFIVCLDACVRAFGGATSFAAIAVVFLAGNAIGSAAPVPGGIGAIEAALIAGLTTTAKLPIETATAAVLLFRFLTFWLPVLPGWLAFAFLQRKQAI